MWYWIIQVSILSLIFIFLLHYLYSFFVSTLTVPKVKDLVTLPQEKYNEMFHSLQQQQHTNETVATTTTQQSMKEDLIHLQRVEKQTLKLNQTKVEKITQNEIKKSVLIQDKIFKI